MNSALPVVERAMGRRDAIALTFDDGPSRWTAEIATAFEAHNAQATFFMRGAEVERDPETVAAVGAAGHELANHLWTHTDASTQTPAEIRDEIERTSDAIFSAAGCRPTLIRPPYCKAAERVAAAAPTNTRAVVLRSVAPGDWDTDSADLIFDKVLGAARPGDIVCMHDGVSPDPRDIYGREATVAAIRRLVPALLERQLRLVTVSELLASELPSH